MRFRRQEFQLHGGRKKDPDSKRRFGARSCAAGVAGGPSGRSEGPGDRQSPRTLRLIGNLMCPKDGGGLDGSLRAEVTLVTVLQNCSRHQLLGPLPTVPAAGQPPSRPQSSRPVLPSVVSDTRPQSVGSGPPHGQPEKRPDNAIWKCRGANSHGANVPKREARDRKEADG